MNEEKPVEAITETPVEAFDGEPTNFNEKRVRFFARREKMFLWLLAPPVLIIGVFVFVTILLWLARQVGILSTLATPQ